MSKILLVDDEEDILCILKTTFLSEGHEIITATNGNEAYAKIKQDPPDILISDILMPQLNGLDLCKKLKTSSQYAHIPIILVTALYKGKEYEAMAKTYGANAVLSKPFDPMELLQIAQALLNPDSTGLKKKNRVRVMPEIPYR